MISEAQVLPTHFAGLFYPEKIEELKITLKTFFDQAEEIPEEPAKAIIVPHAGYVYSGQTAAFGFAQIPKNLINPHFVLIGPSHHHPFTGISTSPHEQWQTIQGNITNRICNIPNKQITLDSKPFIGEHCLEVEIPFLQYFYGNHFTITAFLTGYQLDYLDFAQFLLANFPQSIFIISSDLSHYLAQTEAVEKDNETIDAILSQDEDYFDDEDNTACGMFGVATLMQIAKNKNWQGKLIAKDTSATYSKDVNNVVGYAAIGYYA